MRLLLTADPVLQVPPREYGGVERIVAQLADRLRRHGHEVALVAKEGSTAPCEKFYPWPRGRSSGCVSVAAHVRTIEHAVRTFKPELVHSFSRLLFLLSMLPRRIPKVMSYQRHPTCRPVRRASAFSRGTLRYTACSEYIASLGRSCGGDWTTIYNFVEMERCPFNETVSDDAPLVFLSRIESIKGAEQAIDAAQAAGRKLLLAGNIAEAGREHEYWEQRIKPRLGPQVEYIGPVDDEQKYTLLAGARALLVPIQWGEPFGIVFAEALACGTPVIACPRGALPEIVRHGLEGFLVDTREEAVRAVEQAASISRRMCRQRAERLFSAEAAVPQYESLYQACATDNAFAPAPA